MIHNVEENLMDDLGKVMYQQIYKILKNWFSYYLREYENNYKGREIERERERERV